MIFYDIINNYLNNVFFMIDKMIDNNLDGIEFINVYSMGRTVLGRKLSNFAYTPFDHPVHGHFDSIEGAWYYFCSGKKFEKLRYLSGNAAKTEGRKSIPREWKNEDLTSSLFFKNAILDCLRCKFRTHTDILDVLISTDLPLVHYYMTKNNTVKITSSVNKHSWVLDEIDSIRKKTQEWYIKKNGVLKKKKLDLIKD